MHTTLMCSSSHLQPEWATKTSHKLKASLTRLSAITPKANLTKSEPLETVQICTVSGSSTYTNEPIDRIYLALLEVLLL
jgi:hypothetical protein